tara:strand:+ start:26999 stop:27298 length:300 start_codon:yes stop_codon:yes gene_type:complete
MYKNLILILCFFIISACGLTTTRPKVEMSYAQAAFLAAKEAKAEIHAPGLFRKAEIYYLKAKSAYRRKYFNKAKSYAVLCQKFSEQAEFEATKKLLLNQ